VGVVNFYLMVAENNVMRCKSPKTCQRPQKPRQGDQLIH